MNNRIIMYDVTNTYKPHSSTIIQYYKYMKMILVDARGSWYLFDKLPQ